MKKIFLFILFFSIAVFCFAQEQFWKFENEGLALKKITPRLITPQIYRTLSLSFEQYKTWLNTAPAESFQSQPKGLEISLPYPDNSFKRFRIMETKIMEDALAAQFPQIKTYIGQGIDDPAAAVRIDCTTQGFHAFVLSPAGTLFIDPYQKTNNNLYISYFSKDYINPAKGRFACTFNQHVNLNGRPSIVSSPLTGICIGAQLKTYRTAISCTGEYARAVCPPGNITVANTLSAIVTTMNRVNGVYQSQAGIKMMLVGANALIIYTDSTADPYNGNDNAYVLIEESQSNITSVIGSAAFDIGHTFSTGGGGLSSVGVVCSNSGDKAKGITGLTNPVGDAYDIDYVAHEIGHQFGATHSFESITDNCGGGNRTDSSAYEPGSGTTIMSYTGICGSDNIQPNSDPYFHSKSFDEIVAYTTIGSGNTCPVVTSTGNNSPVVIMPVSDLKIPKETSFTLTGIATDIDGDALTYSWEEWDLSNSNTGSPWNSGANSISAPLFRARAPKTSGSRTFPDIRLILANYPANPDSSIGGLKGETLSKVARDIKFRLMARDNKASGGGVATGGDGCSSTAPFKVVVTNDGPFIVTSPNTALNWLGGTAQTVTWNVANTNAVTGINAQNVDIFMSTDGGNTYPDTIIINTPNDGAENIIVPNIATNNTVRFMIKATGSIFFDISNVNFTITFNAAIQFAIQIRPQPFYNTSNLFLTGVDKRDFNIIIVDVMGRVISKRQISNNEENRIVPLDLSKQATGVYFIKIIQNNTEVTLKALKF